VSILFILALSACGSITAQASQTTHSNDNTYGGLPSWLPKSTLPVHRIVVATARLPRLGIEGDTFLALLSHGQVRITMSGPAVPPFVAPPPPTTPVTFTFSLNDASGVVPIRASDFETVDGAGQITSTRLFVDPGPPRFAPLRKTITFQITGTMATGAGSIRWSPEHRPLTTWDFTVEND
jgi:hypothetical protein